MKQKEQVLITHLAGISRCLHSHDDWWSKNFKEDSLHAQILFNREPESKDKHDFVRRFLSYYEAEWEGWANSGLVRLETARDLRCTPKACAPDWAIIYYYRIKTSTHYCQTFHEIFGTPPTP